MHVYSTSHLYLELVALFPVPTCHRSFSIHPSQLLSLVTMVSSRLLTGAIALLAASVKARVCYPSSIPTLSTTISISTEITSVSESVVTAETDTTSASATSTDTTSIETSTTDLSVTTATSDQTSSDATTLAATATSAPADCINADDCIWSGNPMCFQNPCDCIGGVCIPLLDCSVDSDCSAGMNCINLVCAPVP